MVRRFAMLAVSLSFVLGLSVSPLFAQGDTKKDEPKSEANKKEESLPPIPPEVEKKLEAARRAVDRFTDAHAGRRCFVAGSLGPTSRTASVSQDVSNPAARGVTFDQLREVYATQARALVEGGADLHTLKRYIDATIKCMGW